MPGRICGKSVDHRLLCVIWVSSGPHALLIYFGRHGSRHRSNADSSRADKLERRRADLDDLNRREDGRNAANTHPTIHSTTVRLL